MAILSCYSLPNHPSLTSIDPLGVCDTDNNDEHVPHSALLAKLLDQAEADFLLLEQNDLPLVNAQAWVERLRTLLQDIAYSLHQDHSLDTGGLLEVLSDGWMLATHVRAKIRESLFHSARQLETLFPDGQLSYLTADAPSSVLSASAVDTLLAHLFLGTLQIPPGNTWGRPAFGQYYDGKILPAVRNTAPAYLRTVIGHFADGAYRATLGGDYTFQFELAISAETPDLRSSNAPAVQIHVKVVDVPRDPSSRVEAFVLVAANAQPGPGAGGTHEERLVGQSPALAIAALLTPVLKPREAVVTSALPVHASWQGHGRTAEMLGLYSHSERPLRHYIIADALPLDLSHRQADLRAGNVQREVQKLYAAFAGAKRAAQHSAIPLSIEMPPWGCGAFGGSLNIKIPCMMMAAGLAALEIGNLELLVPEDGGFDLSAVPQHPITIGQLYSALIPLGVRVTRE